MRLLLFTKKTTLSKRCIKVSPQRSNIGCSHQTWSDISMSFYWLQKNYSIDLERRLPDSYYIRSSMSLQLCSSHFNHPLCCLPIRSRCTIITKFLRLLLGMRHVKLSRLKIKNGFSPNLESNSAAVERQQQQTTKETSRIVKFVICSAS